ncbi:DUF2913 family protein [Providencia rettgeri]
MMNSLDSTVSVEDKNRWLGKLAFAALVALKLSQREGKTARHSQAENVFLLRWLQTALKQKRFHRCIAPDFEWLIALGQRRVMTSKIKARLEYLWRSCCCDISEQSALFRLTYATELLKDLGWQSTVLAQGRWNKYRQKNQTMGIKPSFAVRQSQLTSAFDDEGHQLHDIDCWVLGDKTQFMTVMAQHALHGEFMDNSPHFCLRAAISSHAIE